MVLLLNKHTKKAKNYLKKIFSKFKKHPSFKHTFFIKGLFEYKNHFTKKLVFTLILF